MPQNILIFSASPQRDLPIDNLIADRLRRWGNAVRIIPCQRLYDGAPAGVASRDAQMQLLLDFKPGVAVMPPLRNANSIDAAGVLTYHGVAVCSRHTEPSCDWQDFKAMDPRQRGEILGPEPYEINLEIVWGPDEEQILNRRGVPFRTVAVGSFAADVYQDPDLDKKFRSRQALCEQHKLDLNKPTILILTAWGFMDAHPDLGTELQVAANRDEEGRRMWLEMIERVHATYHETHNVLVTLHPNVVAQPYQQVLGPLGIPLDTTSPAVEMVKNSDLVIHAGSTTALGAHFLNRPALQYGDQNQTASWWGRAESPISHVSPYAKSLDELIELIGQAKPGATNASPEAIKQLEQGRYGRMDGQATVRAAELIDKLQGRFRVRWPRSTRNYETPLVVRRPETILQAMACNICGNVSYMATEKWRHWLKETVKLTDEQMKMMAQLAQPLCVHCYAKLMMPG